MLEVGADLAEFDTTPESCLEIERLSFGAATDAYDRLVVRGDVLSLYERGGITRYDHDRIGSVPVLGRNRDPADPVWNFDVFWGAFNEHYEYFDVRAVDWDAVRQHLRPRVKGASREALADVLVEAVRTLADPHVELAMGTETVGSDDARDGSLSAWWRREAGVAEDAGGFVRAMREVVMERLGVRSARALANGRVVVGDVDESTGYIAIGSMWGFANEGGATQLQEVRAAGDAIDEALAELADRRALVLDIRANGGGWDAVSLAIAARFCDRPRVAFTKRARDGDGHTEPQSIAIEPAGSAPFRGRVSLLIGPSTGSAAEIFTLCLMALPNVTTVGMPTWGITSDELAKHLPNGWVVTLSNERYEMPDGRCYEQIGIPPTAHVAPDVGETLEAYLRRGIEAAAQLSRSDRA